MTLLHHGPHRPTDCGTGGVHRLLGSLPDGHERLRSGLGHRLRNRALGAADRGFPHDQDNEGRHRGQQARRSDPRGGSAPEAFVPRFPPLLQPGRNEASPGAPLGRSVFPPRRARTTTDEPRVRVSARPRLGLPPCRVLAAEARTGRLTGARPPTHPVGQGLVRDRPVRLRPKHRVQTPAPGAGGGDVHAASPHHHGHPTRSPRGTPDVPPRHRRASGGNSARDPLALGGRPGPLQRFRGRGAAVTDGPVRRLVPAPSTASPTLGRA